MILVNSMSNAFYLLLLRMSGLFVVCATSDAVHQSKTLLTPESGVQILKFEILVLLFLIQDNKI